MRLQRFVATICASLLLLPPLAAEDYVQPYNGRFAWAARDYVSPRVARISLANSSRLDQLIRAGRIYLSLQDAIALALENNLDIEISRYNMPIADSDVLRAEAGGLLRGIPSSIQAGPNSAVNLQTGAGAGTGISSGNSGSSGTSSSGGTIITSTGSATPNYDPIMFLTYNWGHNSVPQANAINTGIPTLVFNGSQFQWGVQKGWASGTIATLGYGSQGQISNNVFAQINPVNSGSLFLQVQQHVLQGFGFAANNRYIRIAKNDIKVTDLVFRQQVIATVSSMVNLYADLVSFNDNVRVKQQALALNEKLYNDNKKQVEIGTLAPMEIIRAEAEVARSKQDLVSAETQVLQQETIIKNAISKTGISDPRLAEARIVPTDSLAIPATEEIQPVQDLIATALKNRPELEQTRLNIENTRISLAGDRSQLLPTLDVIGTVRNNGLAGLPNSLQSPGSEFIVSPYPGFIGDYGTMLGQIFRRNYPDYSIGFQLTVPFRNRSAQADMIRDELTLRQNQLQQQRQINQLRVEVRNALIGIQQARAQHDAALKARILQEQTLDAEQKKYTLGASTIFFVIQAQRDLSTAQANEVVALSAYNHAKVQLDLATGTTLQVYDVNINEAKTGQVSRPAGALPSTVPPGL